MHAWVACMPPERRKQMHAHEERRPLGLSTSSVPCAHAEGTHSRRKRVLHSQREAQRLIRLRDTLRAVGDCRAAAQLGSAGKCKQGTARQQDRVQCGSMARERQRAGLGSHQARPQLLIALLAPQDLLLPEG
jgi:hypothetical protein